MSRTSSHWLGKYRDLVIAIALFLVLDLGVLVFNFHNSRRIEADAAKINVAGELRTYTQQMTKALLTLDQEMRSELPIQTSMAQLAESLEAFNGALARLTRQAGSLTAVPFLGDDTEARAQEDRLRNELEQTWRPLEREIAPVIASAQPARVDVDIAMTKAVSRNLRMMQQADDLTHQLEATALAKAAQMRRIQLIAISLAALNFVFIIFKFLRSLRKSDEIAQRAREETERILGTVREGLFLVTRDGLIGAQRSASLDKLFGRPIHTGMNLLRLFDELLLPEQAEAARDYVDLLFNPKVKPTLLEQLNPLQEVLVRLSDARLRRGGNFLSFSFDQVKEDGKVVSALLVTVVDVTQAVYLEQELAETRSRAKTEVELLIGVLDQEPQAVRLCLGDARRRIEEINVALQAVEPNASAYGNLINHIARTVHGIKGEAAALNLRIIEQQAHEFEDRLEPLRRRRDLSGDDLIPLAVALNELLEQIVKVEQMVSRLSRFAAGQPAVHPLEPALKRIEQLALRVAEDLNKKVRLETSIPQLADVPEAAQRLFREVLPQLVRNAVAHGIESAEERSRLGKPAEGLLKVELRRDAGGWIISLRDDGRGISPAQLRELLVQKGLYSAAEAAALRDDEVVAKLFEPGFSSLDQANPHAGRGDGLDVVRGVIGQIGGRLRVLTQPDSYTQFEVQLRAS